MHPNPPVVVLVHGAFAESASWNSVIPLLNEQSLDVPSARASLMAVTQRPVTMAALGEGLPAREPAWRRLPSWFVFGELDRNIPAEMLRAMAERAGAQGVQEVAGGSHAISVSNPVPVAEAVLEAVRVTADAR